LPSQHPSLLEPGAGLPLEVSLHSVLVPLEEEADGVGAELAHTDAELEVQAVGQLTDPDDVLLLPGGRPYRYRLLEERLLHREEEFVLDLAGALRQLGGAREWDAVEILPALLANVLEFLERPCGADRESLALLVPPLRGLLLGIAGEVGIPAFVVDALVVAPPSAFRVEDVDEIELRDDFLGSLGGPADHAQPEAGVEIPEAGDVAQRVRRVALVGGFELADEGLRLCDRPLDEGLERLQIVERVAAEQPQHLSAWTKWTHSSLPYWKTTARLLCGRKESSTRARCENGT
jgi:hypothetical protein